MTPNTFQGRARVPIPPKEFCLPYPVDKICGENVWIAMGFAIFLVLFMIVPQLLTTLKKQETGIQVASPIVSTKAKMVQPPQEKTSTDDNEVETNNKDLSDDKKTK